MGERCLRKAEVGGSSPLISTRPDEVRPQRRGRTAAPGRAGEWLRSGTLDGELAVPCDPQSATAGSNI